jgi:hypothetical protein
MGWIISLFLGFMAKSLSFFWPSTFKQTKTGLLDSILDYNGPHLYTDLYERPFEF